MKLRFKFVQSELRALGYSISHDASTGEYWVRVSGTPHSERSAGVGYFTNDINDALATVRYMVQLDAVPMRVALP